MIVRAADGTITKFDAPGAGTGSGQGTIPENINASGEIVGQYVDAKGANHGFLRAADGTITTFDAPGAGTGNGQGTIPFGTTRRETLRATTWMRAASITALFGRRE